MRGKTRRKGVGNRELFRDLGAPRFLERQKEGSIDEVDTERRREEW
jgi:hypothetical protein